LASVTPMMLVPPRVLFLRWSCTPPAGAPPGAAREPRGTWGNGRPTRPVPGGTARDGERSGLSRSDVHTEVLRDAAQAGGVALADGPELPLRAVPVQLAEDHGGLGGGVLRQVVAGDLGAAGLVDDADERGAHLAEGLLAVLRVVDGHREDDLLDVGGDGGEVHLDLLVVALALTGEVVTRVLDGAVGALEVVEEDEVGIAADLARAVQQQGAGVEVEVGAGRGTDVPPQSDDDGGEARRLLAQRYVAALAEADSHESSIGVRGRVAPWCVGCRINESILVTGSR